MYQLVEVEKKNPIKQFAMGKPILSMVGQVLENIGQAEKMVVSRIEDDMVRFTEDLLDFEYTGNFRLTREGFNTETGITSTRVLWFELSHAREQLEEDSYGELLINYDHDSRKLVVYDTSIVNSNDGIDERRNTLLYELDDNNEVRYWDETGDVNIYENIVLGMMTSMDYFLSSNDFRNSSASITPGSNSVEIEVVNGRLPRNRSKKIFAPTLAS